MQLPFCGCPGQKSRSLLTLDKDFSKTAHGSPVVQGMFLLIDHNPLIALEKQAVPRPLESCPSASLVVKSKVFVGNTFYWNMLFREMSVKLLGTKCASSGLGKKQVKADLRKKKTMVCV